MFDINTVIESFKDSSTLNIPKASQEYIKLEYLSEGTTNAEHLQSSCSLPFGTSPVIQAEIICHKILAKADDVKTVYEITLGLPKSFKYFPGDTIGILARNKENEVSEVIHKLGYNEKRFCDKLFLAQVTDTKKKLPVYIPGNEVMTIRRALTECLDLHSVPKKLFMRSLITCTSDDREKRFLEILCSKEGARNYSDFIESPNGTFLGLIRLLTTCRPDFNILLAHLPRLLPRPYSISTSPCHSSGKEIKIVFSFEHGLVTSMLQEMIESDKHLHKYVTIYFRQSTKFCYSEEHFGKNIIMIGPGTGISPFNSFLSYKRDMNETDGESWLMTGCRYKDRNQLFKEEIRTLMSHTGCLTKLSHAFSRDSNSEHRYVQDLIRAEKEEFVQWVMKPNSLIYVCGEGKKMLPDIQNTIVQCLTDVNLMSQNDAIDFVKDLKKSGKYIEDVWI